MHEPESAYLFAYGSLMSWVDGEKGWRERAALAGAARRVGRGSVRGLLIDVGPFPAAIGSSKPHDRIFGELWRLPSRDHALWTMLDHYEGNYAGYTGPFAYKRTKRRVHCEGGRGVRAWIYVWDRPWREFPRIPGGRWQPPGRWHDLSVAHYCENPQMTAA
jgi:gamma-glutamylcyclotransferase (GGCT)/AIG2-like uncharacterized protein YtfP